MLFEQRSRKYVCSTRLWRGSRVGQKVLPRPIGKANKAHGTCLPGCKYYMHYSTGQSLAGGAQGGCGGVARGRVRLLVGTSRLRPTSPGLLIDRNVSRLHQNLSAWRHVFLVGALFAGGRWAWSIWVWPTSRLGYRQREPPFGRRYFITVQGFALGIAIQENQSVLLAPATLAAC